MATAISGKKVFIPKPPDKGSFPIDHEGECRKVMLEYLNCLHKSDSHSNSCRDIAKKYLECRMDKQLMAKEDWDKLGFSQEENKKNEDTKVEEKSGGK